MNGRWVVHPQERKTGRSQSEKFCGGKKCYCVPRCIWAHDWWVNNVGSVYRRIRKYSATQTTSYTVLYTFSRQYFLSIQVDSVAGQRLREGSWGTDLSAAITKGFLTIVDNTVVLLQLQLQLMTWQPAYLHSLNNHSTNFREVLFDCVNSIFLFYYSMFSAICSWFPFNPSPSAQYGIDNNHMFISRKPFGSMLINYTMNTINTFGRVFHLIPHTPQYCTFVHPRVEVEFNRLRVIIEWTFLFRCHYIYRLNEIFMFNDWR